jgi:hypothetical protein
MINIQSVTVSTDGQNKRISIAWDEIDDSGKTIATNQRLSRIITDKTLLDCANQITELAEQMITE